MANLNEKAATEALNEEQYINKLYDYVQDNQKKLLEDAYAGNREILDTEEQNVQQQTATNLERTNTEAVKVQQEYKPSNVSDAISQQVALSTGNQQKKNVSTLQTAQAEADAEIDRRRALLGEQYAAAIKQAQAANDMLRAEQLYAEAKAKDEQIRALKTEAGKLLAETGDNSLLISMLDGSAGDTGTTGGSWSDVFKNEDSINAIYDNANEAQQQSANSATAAILSQLKAQREQEQRETDKALTQTYVNALRAGKNDAEVQKAYGMGSGNLAQRKLARALGTTENMTAIRENQQLTDAQIGQKVAEAIQNKNNTVADAIAENERNRAQALYDAAAAEEQSLIDTQKTVGTALAEHGDFSVLGKLYGLTQEQIDRLKNAYEEKENSKKESASKDSNSSGNGSGGQEEGLFNKPEKEETEIVNNPVQVGLNNLIDLGYGPINQEGLAQLIEEGKVLPVPTENGMDYIKIPENAKVIEKQTEKGTEYVVVEDPKYSVANKSQKDKMLTDQYQALTQPFNVTIPETKEEPKQEESKTVLEKVVDSVKNAMNNQSSQPSQLEQTQAAIEELKQNYGTQQEEKSFLGKLVDAVKNYVESQPSQLKETQAAIEELKKLEEKNKNTTGKSTSNSSSSNKSGSTSTAKKQIGNQNYVRQ